MLCQLYGSKAFRKASLLASSRLFIIKSLYPNYASFTFPFFTIEVSSSLETCHIKSQITALSIFDLGHFEELDCFSENSGSTVDNGYRNT